MGYLSFSHCKDAIILVWHEKKIGIDIERQDRDFNYAKLAKKYFFNSNRSTDTRKVYKNFILNLECTSLPSLEWGIPSIDTEAIPKSYKICIKPTSLVETNYSKLADPKLTPGIYILYSKPIDGSGVSFKATPVRRIFCRPKPFCKKP